MNDERRLVIVARNLPAVRNPLALLPCEDGGTLGQPSRLNTDGTLCVWGVPLSLLTRRALVRLFRALVANPTLVRIYTATDDSAEDWQTLAGWIDPPSPV